MRKKENQDRQTVTEPEAPKKWEKDQVSCAKMCEDCGETAALARVEVSRRGGKGEDGRAGPGVTTLICRKCYDEHYHGCKVLGRPEKPKLFHDPDKQRRILV